MKLYSLILLVIVNASFGQNLALKNFGEIYTSLQVATGVEPDAVILKQFNEIKEFLPQKGMIEEYTGSMQLGLLRLVGDFCSKRVSMDASLPETERWLHHEVDFAKAPGTYPDALRKKLIQEYAEVFWQRPASSNEVDSLTTSYKEMSTVTSDAKRFFTFFCVAFGTSIDFLTI